MQPRFGLFGLSTRSISYSPGAGVWNCLHGSGRPPNVDSRVATFPAMVDRTISFVYREFWIWSISIASKSPLILRPVISYADGPNKNVRQFIDVIEHSFGLLISALFGLRELKSMTSYTWSIRTVFRCMPMLLAKTERRCRWLWRYNYLLIPYLNYMNLFTHAMYGLCYYLNRAVESDRFISFFYLVNEIRHAFTYLQQSLKMLHLKWA